MASHDMFLTMILTNARRGEAQAVVLSVNGPRSRIDMRLGDGSSQELTAPPSEIVLKIIESLESGQKSFRSSVFEATVEEYSVERGKSGTVAHISAWSIEHT